MQAAGSDVVLQKADASGIALSREVLNAQREELGLDQPFLVQYGSWLVRFLKGDLGVSYVSGEDVFSTFVSKLPATLLLTFVSVIFTVIISVPLGILSAVKKDKAADRLIRIFSFIGGSLPNFFVALVLMYLLAVRFPIFPVISEETGIQSVMLPAITLALAMSSRYVRQVPGSSPGRAGEGVCPGGKGKRNPLFLHALEKCDENSADHDPYPAFTFCGEPSGRNGCRGVYLLMGRRRKACRGCGQHAGLSDDSGICGLDGSNLRGGQSGGRFGILPAGSQDPAGR